MNHTTEKKHDDEPTTLEGLWYAIVAYLCTLNEGHTGKTNRLNGFTNAMKLGIQAIRQIPVTRFIENITIGELKDMIPTSMKSVQISDKHGNIKPIFAELIHYQACTNRNLRYAVEAMATLKHQQMQMQLEAQAKGHYMETPQGMGLSKEAYRAFGLELDDPIMVVEVNPSDYANAKFDNDDISEIGEYRHGLKVKNYGLTEEDNKTSHLCINNETIKDINIHVPAYYCGTKNGGCGKSYGSNQVRHYHGCPACSKVKSMLSPQNVNITLPLVRNGKLVRSKVGQVEFRTLRLCRSTYNTLSKVKSGRAEAWEGLEALLTNQQKMRYSSGKTTWVAAEIKPVVFDVIGHDFYLGLCVDFMKSGQV